MRKYKIVLGSVLAIGLSLALVMGVNAQTVKKTAKVVLPSSPQQILNVAMDNLIKMKSTDCYGSIVTKQNNQKKVTKKTSDDSYVDFLTPSPKFNIDFDCKIDKLSATDEKAEYNFNITVDGITSTPQTFVLKLVSMNKQTYFKLDLPTGLDLGFFDMSALANRWIKIDKEALGQSFLGEKYDGVTARLATETDEVKADKEFNNILKSFRKNQVLLVSKSKSTKLGDLNTVHLTVKINKSGFKKFMIESNKITGGKAMTKAELKELETSLQKAVMHDIQVWVDKKTVMPVKIMFGNMGTKDKISDTLSRVQINLTNFNSPKEVLSPPYSTSLEDIFAEMMEKFKADYSASTTDTVNVGL